MGTFTYKQKEVKTEASSSPPRVAIDSLSIQMSRDEGAKAYNTAELPYRHFKSLDELLRAVIDDREAQM